jgi:hypothetical protein
MKTSRLLSGFLVVREAGSGRREYSVRGVEASIGDTRAEAKGEAASTILLKTLQTA